MGVASGCGYQEVVSGWNLWVWLECMGVVICGWHLAGGIYGYQDGCG